MKKILLLVFALSVNHSQSQTAYSIDTTYTIKSTYAKLIKKYPFIKIAEAKKDENVDQIYDIVYNKQKERALHLDSFVNSKEEKRNPVVILIHGGGWKSGNKNQMWVLAQEIASRGYTCFAVEYRLSTEAKYPQAIYDVKNAIKFIKDNAKRFHANPNKIAILGCSSGGQMAALIGTTNEDLTFEDTNNTSKTSSKVNAIIDIDGILAFKHPESNEEEMAAFWLNGTYEENSENWNKASALSHANKNTPPILFINSSFERFHAGRDDMIAILNQNSIYSEVKTIANTPHSFWFFEPWLQETVGYTTQFLDKIFK
ncbi:alpha/beta hydrolase [Flavobacterium sp. Fl-318]|uniref:Alpha/beta hydrolase n=1 Tax=Flavobacterium cupriresistens TaxID=2893885 RepID=A0ABU4RGT6_9FLAO|nr:MULTISPECIES: alpha/beta hydrolase [unclassified Flavobacterium]MDX6191779.1 alpha/beta hydrolase [Flavobacterium sp. Fl-318]UFH41722.1 alpha/beta hydrolase [Flavobacterium sp. F-323]